MPLVCGILDRLHEVRVAPDAATVLRWAGPRTFQAQWVLHFSISLHDSLEENLVIPRITKIVLVLEPEPLAGARQNVADLRGRGVLVLHVLEVLLHQVGVAVKLLPDPEVVEV